ncbi:phosphatase PAP2 family protein [Microbacterium sp. SORGH_AS_0888]|uniref:phosphatase PAP2 family protein n=1 Tax=Microbacterium sp. SORGH_AS_0888 TaxID=3041791 RepID=UPI00278B4E4A|nr:phosphatase PAP2 family protein [Microbacterium sp. SORGH_AS_0888]MDQ1131236.1 membrane-associated phospholipid phosphatase [Microbacterium sp. SORGH_AS_0888]
MSTPSRADVRRAHSRARATGILRPSRHPAAVLVTAVVAVALLTALGFVLRSHPIDLALSQRLNTLHTGAIGAISNAAYAVISPVPAIAITVVLTGVVWAASRQLRVAVAFAVVVAATWIPSDLVKLLVHRPRPDVALMTYPFSPVQPDPSYPSGHTVFIVTLVIAVILLLRGTRWLPVGVAVGAVLIALVGAALSIDAVHYPTDVAASIVWALAVAPAARLIWVDWLTPRIPFLR